MGNYIDENFSSSNTDLIALFRVEPNNVSFEKAVEAVASESSIGTWTEVVTLTKEIKQKLKPTAFYLDKRKKLAKIAYPLSLFESSNIPQLMSSVAGNIFGMRALKNLKLLDISFPEKFLKNFLGPRFGISGIRKLLKVKHRPLVGTIVKPKVGLNAKEHAQVAFNSWLGGCDIVKDDENLTSMEFNKFEDRVIKTLKQRDTCEKETGEKKIYMPNITAPYKEMFKRANFVEESGCEYAMVDVVSVGWSALQDLREEGFNLVLHGHRAGHAAFTRNPKHGISMLLLAKLCRMIGLDQLHVGAIVGKMHGSREEVLTICEEIRSETVKENLSDFVLEQKWFGLRSMFPVCSGGLSPEKVPPLMKNVGVNAILQFGGGIHGHPNGTTSGAKAVRQAIDSVLKNIPLKDYAKTHKELGLALKHWKS